MLAWAGGWDSGRWAGAQVRRCTDGRHLPVDCVLLLLLARVEVVEPGRLLARDSRMAEMPQLQSSWLARASDDRLACLASSNASVGGDRVIVNTIPFPLRDTQDTAIRSKQSKRRVNLYVITKSHNLRDEGRANPESQEKRFTMGI